MPVQGWGSAWNKNSAIQHGASDFEVASPPDDTVSSLAFSPAAEPPLLLATSWSCQASIWQVPGPGSTIPKATIRFSEPLLCSAWSPDGNAAFAGGCDNKVHLWNLQTNQLQQVAAHRQPVRHVGYLKEIGLLVTGSWDKTLQYWDLRQPQAVNIVSLPERVYAFSLEEPLLALGLAERHILLYNLKNPQQAFTQTFSGLKFQTRCLACFAGGTGFAQGSVEGRVACQWLQSSSQQTSFSFKCHRSPQGNGIYAVNAVNMLPQQGTLATAGSDGSVAFWDIQHRKKLSQLPNVGQTVSCAAFSRDGALYACAASYDWSKGYAPASPHRIILHPMSALEMGRGDQQLPRR